MQTTQQRQHMGEERFNGWRWASRPAAVCLRPEHTLIKHMFEHSKCAHYGDARVEESSLHSRTHGH